MDVCGWALEVVGENAAIKLSGLVAKADKGALPGIVVGGISPASIGQVFFETLDGAIDIVGFFDPGWGESIHAEQVMRHPKRRIFEWIGVERDGLTLMR